MFTADDMNTPKPAHTYNPSTAIISLVVNSSGYLMCQKKKEVINVTDTLVSTCTEKRNCRAH